MTDIDERISIPQWRYAPDAWRWVSRFNDRHARSVLRVRSARILPASMRARFLAMDIPNDILDATLASITAPDKWSNAWIETAQRFLGDYRRQVSSKQLLEAAQSRRLAALSYHAAQVFNSGDERTIRTCRAAAASLFAQAQPYVYPDARRLTVPWRAHRLPAYVQTPAGNTARNGLVVFLNGASTSKEESFAWAESFLRAGMAVLSLDSPGTGEASGVPNPNADDDDILDGVFEIMQNEPSIDLAQVSVVGASLGGNLAVRSAAYDRRIMCSVVVTPPFDPPRWIGRASPLLIQQLATLFDATTDDPFEAASRYALNDTVPRLKSPLLVFGAGHDLVVPPSEAQLLAARGGSLASLVWYPNSGHCLYDAIPTWTAEAATWISSVAAARAFEYQTAGYADPLHVAEVARDQLRFADTMGQDFWDDEGGARLIDPPDADADDIGSYARVITPAPSRDGPSDHAT